MNRRRKLILFIGLFLFLAIGSKANAFQLGENFNFYIESSYDISGRSELSAALIKVTPKVYFFVDKNWWDSLGNSRQSEVSNTLDSLSQEFENKIYPDLTSAFGSEWNPGIDGDEKITVLLQQMKEGVGGYFRDADEYLRVQAPGSNEREMVYLATSQIETPKAKAFLSHEFVHLITFNQKDKIYGISEETWLNEARAEYAPTLLGYDSVYEGSNLQNRAKIFLEDPFDSLTEWQNRREDYGVLNLFTQYLVDHYGVGVLIDSLKSNEIGIPSINDALLKNGYHTDFGEIFTNWTIAAFINDCELGQDYCYLNENLSKIHVSPAINFLPLYGKSTLSITDVTKNWTGEWQKFIGGNGTLKFDFQGLTGLNFKVPYFIQDKAGKYSFSFLVLDKNQKGEIYVSDFNTKNVALIAIPSLQSRISGFDGVDPTYPFTITVSVIEANPQEDAELIQKLLAQIASLQAEIAKIKAQIDAKQNKSSFSCQRIVSNLSVGVINNAEVKCLQEFLKVQGTDIYPEGLVTGYFGQLTKSAVIRFQEKYKTEILSPLGLEKGTGYVGLKTKEKINELLKR